MIYNANKAPLLFLNTTLFGCRILDLARLCRCRYLEKKKIQLSKLKNVIFKGGHVIASENRDFQVICNNASVKSTTNNTQNLLPPPPITLSLLSYTKHFCLLSQR